MRHRYPSCRALATFLVAVVPTAVLAPPAPAENVLPVESFRSVTLRHGGKVRLRHGRAQRVTMLEGSTDHSRVTVAGDRLVIERCREKCPRGYELVVEVVTPGIAGIAVMDGGVIESHGRFPRQPDMSARVENGGTIDLRSMSVDAVDAGVAEGGRILTIPRNTLTASIRNGGNVTYWGNPSVTSSVKHGGVVAAGSPGDADKPLPEFGPGHAAPLPVPALPPLPTRRVRGTF